MSGGKHASDEEFELEFDVAIVKKIAIVVAILLGIVGLIAGGYKLISKRRQASIQDASAQPEKMATAEEYPVLGKIKIEKIQIEQPIFDSAEEEALQKGVIKLYGGNLNEERKFLYSRA